MVVSSPQILKNFLRSSSDGLSVNFLIIWLSGDFFNVFGAILQGVKPTMIILAAYYAVADTILLGQCFYYRGFTLSDAPSKYDENAVEEDVAEESPLLWRETLTDSAVSQHNVVSDLNKLSRRESPSSSLRSNPDRGCNRDTLARSFTNNSSASIPSELQSLRAILFNTSAVILVFLAGIIGWYAGHSYSYYQHPLSSPKTNQAMDLWGQIFGYFCAALYLGARIPQILLNHSRKSTEGVSVLFFIFACLGNLTYVFSIFTHVPRCAWAEGIGNNDCESGEWQKEYARYVLVNASWIVGSAGTFFLDLVIFGQFCCYQGSKG